MRIGIVEPDDFSKKAIYDLEKLGKVQLFNPKGNLIKFISDKEVLFVRLKNYWGKDLLVHAKKLKAIVSPTTGLNHIDERELRERKIELISLKGENDFLSSIRATPEHTLGLILALLRGYTDNFLSASNQEWNRDKHRGGELYERNVGLIGLGRVGKLVALYLNALGSKIFFYDINKEIISDKATRINKLEDLLNKCSVVVMCASYSGDNHTFFGKKHIDCLKDKYFVNTARGELIDEEYLLKKLEEGYFKGVALDVISDETGKNNLDRFRKLAGKRNFILTAHIAGSTYESIHKTEEFVVEKLVRKNERK